MINFKCMIQSNLILVPNLVAFISQKEKNVCFFDYHSLTCCVRKMVLICLMQNIDMYLLYKSHQIARLVSHLIKAADDDAGKLQPVFLKGLYLLHICIFSFFLFNASLTTI